MQKVLASFFVVLLACTLPVRAADDLSDAQRAELEEMVKKGDRSAMVKLGNWYVSKETPETDRKAAELFGAAVVKEDAQGMVGLGLLLQRGYEIAKDKDGKPIMEQSDKAAAALFKKAADLGNSAGLTELAACYRSGKGVDKDEKKAVELFEKAAQGGSVDAMIALGDAYEDGIGVAVDGKKAMEYYRKAADQGSAYAMYEVGHCYEEGVGTEKDLKQMFEWYKKSADGGDASGMKQMGIAHRLGRGTSMNLETAKEWFRKAAIKGDYSALYDLGQMLEDDKQMEDAIKTYKLGKERGDEKCSKRLEELKVKD